MIDRGSGSYQDVVAPKKTGLSSLLDKAKMFLQDAVQQQRTQNLAKRESYEDAPMLKRKVEQEQQEQQEQQELSIYDRLNTPVSKEQGEKITDDSIAKTMELVNSLSNLSGIPYGKLPSIIKHTALKESKYGSDPLTYDYREIVPGEPEKGTVGHGGIGQVTYKRTRQLLTGDNRARDVKELVEKFEEQTGQNVNDIVADKESMDAFLEVPFNGIFLSTLQYVDALGNEPLAREALRKGAIDNSTFRKVFYAGQTDRSVVKEAIRKLDEIASRYQGGMVSRDPYKRQPRFI